MADEWVRKASTLLARRASAGVAAPVFACLPPRVGKQASQVRRRGGRVGGGPRGKGEAWVALGGWGRLGHARRGIPGLLPDRSANQER
ncbi:hypothetical protein NDU88_011934 [Pleurodeles waltl]|uniref:Uncharacterized protein n=1 Tax=Pleurodeles waltl TaxID=8319 RepID=A0AAV7R4G5_PLEWA|nr:hypothetical protein NDU88_011934 [Pleurodeles waltl]